MGGHFDSRPRPVTFGMTRTDLAPPLGNLQAVEIDDKAQMLILLQNVAARAESPMAPTRVARALERAWPELEKNLTRIRPDSISKTEVERSSDEILEEVLQGVRILMRNQTDERERLAERERLLTSQLGSGHGYLDSLSLKEKELDAWRKRGTGPSQKELNNYRDAREAAALSLGRQLKINDMVFSLVEKEKREGMVRSIEDGGRARVQWKTGDVTIEPMEDICVYIAGGPTPDSVH